MLSPLASAPCRSLWWSFYLFSVGASKLPFNWTLSGALLLTQLFQARARLAILYRFLTNAFFLGHGMGSLRRRCPLFLAAEIP